MINPLKSMRDAISESTEWLCAARYCADHAEAQERIRSRRDRITVSPEMIQYRLAIHATKVEIDYCLSQLAKLLPVQIGIEPAIKDELDRYRNAADELDLETRR